MTQPQQPAPQDRILAAWRLLVRGELPTLTYLPLYEYAVQSSDGSTVDCDLTDTTIPLPNHLAKVPLRWLSGEQVTPSQGQRCLIAFLGGDPARPVCVGGDPAPSTRTIEASSTLTLKGGGMPATEHVATVEGVVNMFVSFLYFLVAAGNPSTWSASGNIFDPTDTPLATLQTRLATWLSNCNVPSLPTPTTAGGIMLTGVEAAIVSALAAKIPDVIPGLTPTGVGAPSVKTG